MFGSSLRISYLLIFVFACLLLVLSWLIVPEQQWGSAFLSDFAAGVFGSLIIIFFVDSIIERNKERGRRELVKIALRRLRFPILQHMTLLCNLYKAAARNKPQPLPTTFEETFGDDYYKEISFLDFSKEAPVALRMDWFAYLDSETAVFKEKLEKLLDTYAASLDVTLIDIIEKLTNSRFILAVPQIRMLPAIDRQYGVKREYRMFSGIEDFVKEHVCNMLELVKYFNSHSDMSPVELTPGLWGDRGAPTWGSGRVTSKHEEEHPEN